MVRPDPAEVVVVLPLDVLLALLVVPLLLVPLPLPLVLVLLLHAVSIAPVASSAVKLVIVSDLFMGYLIGLLLERLVAMRFASSQVRGPDAAG